MNWYFIRHGEIGSNKRKVYSGRSSEPLTEHGVKQVEAACDELARLNIEAVYCSPLARTRQTSDIIVSSMGRDIPVFYDNSFIELKMGPWEGLAEHDVEIRYSEEWKLWNSHPAELALEGRETLDELQARVISGMQAIRNNSGFPSPRSQKSDGTFLIYL